VGNAASLFIVHDLSPRAMAANVTGFSRRKAGSLISQESP